MSNCNGHCFSYCSCECKENECSCGHSQHEKIVAGPFQTDIYCKNFNVCCSCFLKKCHNFEYCKRSMPNFLIELNNEMCIYCAVYIGKLYFNKKEEQCPICLEKKEVVTVSCQKHSFCLECWKNYTETNIKITCPLCRENIWSWKQTERL
jgi:hypothetical protein